MEKSCKLYFNQVLDVTITSDVLCILYNSHTKWVNEHFTSLVLMKTHKPILVMRKTTDKLRLGAVYKFPGQSSLRLLKLWKEKQGKTEKLS